MAIDKDELRRRAELTPVQQLAMFKDEQPGWFSAGHVNVECEDLISLLDEIDQLKAEKYTLGKDLIAANTLRQQETDRRHDAEQKLRAVADATR